MARILVIDDEELLRKTVRVILEVDGHEVLEAADGDLALGILRAQGADLVLVDMFMPKRDGLEVIRALRDVMPRPKIVAMSGGGKTGQLDMLSAAAAMGAARTIAKPFQPRELLAVIRDVLTEPG